MNTSGFISYNFFHCIYIKVTHQILFISPSRYVYKWWFYIQIIGIFSWRNASVKVLASITQTGRFVFAKIVKTYLNWIVHQDAWLQCHSSFKSLKHSDQRYAAHSGQWWVISYILLVIRGKCQNDLGIDIC